MDGLKSIEFIEQLGELGFKDLGSLWFGNKHNTIRIRIWNHNEIIFWSWGSSVDTELNEIRFIGKIYDISDVVWVLNRCFDIQLKDIL